MFTLNTNQTINYASMLAGTSFSNSDMVTFPDGPFSQLTVSESNPISGYINLCFSLNYAPVNQVGESVTVKYVDEAEKSISEHVMLSGNIGDTCTSEQKTIEGYVFKEVQGDTTGQVTDRSQTVTYIYTKNPVVGANVTVKYVDEAEKSISEDVVLSGNIGDTYISEQKIIEGYTFKEVKSSIAGQFTDQVQNITYVYTKDKVSPVNPESKSDNNSNHKGENNGDGTLSSSKHSLPETGENEILAKLSIILGLIFLVVGLIASAFYFKKYKR